MYQKDLTEPPFLTLFLMGASLEKEAKMLQHKSSKAVAPPSLVLIVRMANQISLALKSGTLGVNQISSNKPRPCLHQGSEVCEKEVQCLGLEIETNNPSFVMTMESVGGKNGSVTVPTNLNCISTTLQKSHQYSGQMLPPIILQEWPEYLT